MGEQRSRINACNSTEGWDLNTNRWREAMATPFLHKGLWRKSWQVGGLAAWVRGRPAVAGAGGEKGSEAL